MNAKHICLLGFSKQIEQELRQYISKHTAGYTFSWVAANAPKLDAVVVNALFLNTPQIKKYLKTVSCPKVAAYSNEAGDISAKEHAMPAINLSDLSLIDNHWLSAVLGTQDEAAAPAKNVVEHPAAEVFDADEKVSQDFHALIEEINKRQASCIIARYGDKITYINPKEGHAYINFPRDNVPGIENWAWHLTNSTSPSESMRRLNLDQWLFETIWQSQSTVFNVDHNMLYKLVKWPQPFSQSGRTEALRLAAQIKFQPITIADLISKTNYSNDMVEQFLFATAKAGQVEAIKPNKVNMQKPDHAAVRQSDPDREVKRGFIGRLRKKLGL